MPSPNRSLPGLWSLLVAGLVGLLALGGGWWLGQRQSASQASADPKRTLLAKEATRLRLRLDADEAGPADRQRLLELLVATGARLAGPEGSVGASVHALLTTVLLICRIFYSLNYQELPGAA